MLRTRQLVRATTTRKRGPRSRGLADGPRQTLQSHKAMVRSAKGHLAGPAAAALAASAAAAAANSEGSAQPAPAAAAAAAPATLLHTPPAAAAETALRARAADLLRRARVALASYLAWLRRALRAGARAGHLTWLAAPLAAAWPVHALVLRPLGKGARKGGGFPMCACVANRRIVPGKCYPVSLFPITPPCRDPKKRPPCHSAPSPPAHACPAGEALEEWAWEFITSAIERSGPTFIKLAQVSKPSPTVATQA